MPQLRIHASRHQTAQGADARRPAKPGGDARSGRRVVLEPFAQCVIHSGLPPGTASTEGGKNITVNPNGNLLLGTRSRGPSTTPAGRFNARAQEALNFHDKSDGRHQGMRQFLDDKAFKPGLGEYDKRKA